MNFPHISHLAQLNQTPARTKRVIHNFPYIAQLMQLCALPRRNIIIMYCIYFLLQLTHGELVTRSAHCSHAAKRKIISIPTSNTRTKEHYRARWTHAFAALSSRLLTSGPISWLACFLLSCRNLHMSVYLPIRRSAC